MEIVMKIIQFYRQVIRIWIVLCFLLALSSNWVLDVRAQKAPRVYKHNATELSAVTSNKDHKMERYYSSTFTNCATQAEIPKVECDALVALSNSTNGASWINHAGWLQTNTPCSWHGVTCTAGHVTALDQADNNLTGNIPPELGNLTSLTNLHLGTNYLTGSIPT